ncbi:MAG: 50S ribosomal protein L25 [Verrucomicrobiota bacterium]
MEQHTLNVVTREATGRGIARRLRAEGKVPASVYGKGKARSISVSAVDFRSLNREIGGGAALVELVDEKGEKALSLIQDVQIHATKDTVDHIDFQEVERGHSFVTHIPVHLVNQSEAVGVRIGGGVVDHKAYEVEIRCRPSKLPDQVKVDVATLDIGDAIHISDLPALDGVEYLGEPSLVIVSIQAPTVAVETASETEAADAGEVPATKVKTEDDASS